MLGGGAALGLILAVSGALEPLRWRTASLPAGVVARVNDEMIAADELAIGLQAVAADRRDALTPDDRTRVLDRLMDEALLVQRGVAIGLVESDRTVRRSIAEAMIESVIVDSKSAGISDTVLRAFHAEHPARFQRPGVMHLRQVAFRSGEGTDQGTRDAGGQPTDQGPHDGSYEGAHDTLARAERAAAAIRDGMSIDEAIATFGDTTILPLPDAPLPAAALRRFVGPTAMEAVLSLDPGDVTAPLYAPYGHQLLMLIDREPPHVPALDEIRDEVEAAYVREVSDEALRSYLRHLRSDAEIQVSPEERE
jgi:hypothetical protein